MRNTRLAAALLILPGAGTLLPTRLPELRLRVEEGLRFRELIERQKKED